MLEAIARRGPDSVGEARWPGVWLGHRRLAILDLSPAGHQPMLNGDGSVGIVFNGCIYNFLELRAELESAGHRFRSRCDTEVLVRGYEHWGMEAMMPRLRGMYAFAIWDERRRKLSLGRDRMGVKPLVYRHTAESFAFASSVGALEAAGLGGESNPEAILEYLEYGFITNSHSVYRNMRKLGPGEWLEWEMGSEPRTRSYWRMPRIDRQSKIGFEEAVEETERLLRECVRLRLQADVPVGALLSGGVDSSLVCWAMKEEKADVRAFTVGAPGEAEDESAAARAIARKLGIAHEVVELEAVGEELMEDFLAAYSEPFACQSAFGILAVSQRIKPLATVLLTGDGGDDVFLGYPFFQNIHRSETLAGQLPGVSAGLWETVREAWPQAGSLGRVRSFLDYTTGGLGPYARLHDGLPYLEQNGLLGERLQGLKLPQRQIPPSIQSARQLLEESLDLHWQLHFTGEFMTKVDGGTAHYALEARAPFLDHKLWDFAAQLPGGLRLEGGVLKAILREIARRRVNAEVGSRAKQGFTVPVSRWMRDGKSPLWAALRERPRVVEQGWMDAAALERLLGQPEARQELRPGLWHVLMLEQWLRRHTGGQ